MKVRLILKLVNWLLGLIGSELIYCKVDTRYLFSAERKDISKPQIKIEEMSHEVAPDRHLRPLYECRQDANVWCYGHPGCAACEDDKENCCHCSVLPDYAKYDEYGLPVINDVAYISDEFIERVHNLRQRGDIMNRREDYIRAKAEVAKKRFEEEIEAKEEKEEEQ